MSTAIGSERTVAAYLSAALPEFQVTHVFELVGGMITVLLDAVHQNPALTVVSMHHEQGAGFAAEGFARTAGRPAVAMATSGPGATNLLTAVGSCYFDSIPVVFITGQVNTHEKRSEGRGRQGGFQETDIVPMAQNVTKWATSVSDPDTFPTMLAEAFRIATTGRPGPVLLDIPMDVQRGFVTEGSQAPITAVSGPVPAQDVDDFVEELRSALGRAQRPLILAGGGIRIAGAAEEFARAVQRWRIPVVESLMGVDALAASSDLRVGFIGSYGNRWANWAVAQSDLLLVVGSRLDVRQTGSDIEGFRGNRQLFHVDIDSGELNNHVPGCRTLRADARTFISDATDPLANDLGWPHWVEDIAHHRSLWPAETENVPDGGINPNQAIRELNEIWYDTAAFVTDVGQHQMWAAQSIVLSEGQRFLTSGGMGSMGFGLPAAIGAALASAGEPVCLFAGDGGFQCNIQELQTLVRLGAPVRIVILDNDALGMVRQFQESYFSGRYFSTVWGYSAPDFAQIARAYGIPAWRVDSHQELIEVSSKVLALDGGPSLLHLKIDPALNAYPKMAFGQPFGSMEPFVAPLEMEGT